MPFTCKSNGNDCETVTLGSLAYPNKRNSSLPVTAVRSKLISSVTFRIIKSVELTETDNVDTKSNVTLVTFLGSPVKGPPTTLASTG